MATHISDEHINNSEANDEVDGTTAVSAGHLSIYHHIKHRCNWQKINKIHTDYIGIPNRETKYQILDLTNKMVVGTVGQRRERGRPALGHVTAS